jgi:hypothetical protein
MSKKLITDVYQRADFDPVGIESASKDLKI